jgi:CRISPR-associated endoribonuclease Cas6
MLSDTLKSAENNAEKEVTPDLMAARLRLRPLEEALISRNQRREIYWLFLQLIAEQNPDLAEELRSGSNLRPFTLSNLYCPDGVRRGENVVVTPEQDCYFRITALTPELVNCLTEIARQLPTTAALGELPVTLDGLDFSSNEEARTDATTYRSILEECFYGFKPVPNRFAFRFLSPTGFKSDGIETALPQPRLVFGSLLGRWNAFAPGPLAEDSRLFAEVALRAGRFRIESRSVMVDNQFHNGFVGTVEFRATGRDRFYLQTLEALWRYSFYAGVGYQTSAGMGQVLPLHSLGVNKSE